MKLEKRDLTNFELLQPLWAGWNVAAG